jgi:hypothetical protein
MRAFVCEVDHHGLRRLLPEDLLPAEELRRLARDSSRRPAAVVRALLDETDAEDLRAEVAAGRYGDACGTLLNRAVELLPLASVMPAPARSAATTPSRAW